MHQHTPHAPEALAPETIDSRRRYLCRHIFTQGHRCGSPALRGHEFCYYHRAARPPMPLAGRTGMFTMPRIDDRAAIQIALFEVLSRISAGDIDLRRANSILHGLQIASSNLHRSTGAEPAATAQDAPLVEEITRDFHFGDLAPILELPSDDAALPSPPEPPQFPVILSEAGENSNPVILSGGAHAPQSKDLLSDPATETHESVIPSEAGQSSSRVPHSSRAFGAMSGETELRDKLATWQNDRIPIPPSCFAHSPELIASDAAERAHIAEEIHSAMQSAARRLSPPFDAGATLEPRTSLEPCTSAHEPRASLPPSAPAP